MSAGASAAERLCSRCGLCCNGVMFFTVRLQPRDSPVTLAATGLKLKRRNKHHYIQQPCPAHCGERCSIYHQRPERCRIFECRQLTRVAAGEITEVTAMEMITDIQQRVRQLESLLDQGGTSDPKRPLAKRYEKIMGELLVDSAHHETSSLRMELTEKMQALDRILDGHFRLPTEDAPADSSAEPVEPPNFLAVYGTLMQGQPGQRLAGIKDQLTYVGPCKLTGSLYDLGEYPGLVPGPGEVMGQIFQLQDPNTLTLLDRYEGCIPGEPSSLFVRRRIETIEYPAGYWVYLYNGSVGSRPPIQSGDWIGYLTSRTISS